jgi:Tol biopolymer transport system component
MTILQFLLCVFGFRRLAGQRSEMVPSQPLLVAGVLVALVLLLPIHGYAQNDSNPSVSKHQMEVLGQPVSNYALLASTVISESPNGCRLANIEQALLGVLGNKLILDGDQIKDFVPAAVPLFSPDGRHIAFVNLARISPVNLDVVVDGKEKQGFGDAVVKSLAFSTDGNHFGFVTETNHKTYRFIIDDQAGPEVDDIKTAPIFSADGKRFAYVAGKGSEWLVVIDGVLGPNYDDVGQPVFSRDGKHIAYAARKGPLWMVTVDGKAGQGFNCVKPDPIFSPDGSRIAYEAYDSDSLQVVLDGDARPLLHIDGTPPTDLIFSPDGKHIAYTARMKKSLMLGWDDQLIPAGDGKTIAAFNPTFSADSAHLFFQTWGRLFVDGKPGLKFDRVTSEAVVSPDHKHIVYGAERDGKYMLVIDQNERPALGLVMRLVFSPNGKRLAYLAYTYTGAQQRCHVVVDNNSGPDFDYIPVGPVIRKDHVLEYIGGLNTEQGVVLYRVTVPEFAALAEK